MAACSLWQMDKDLSAFGIKGEAQPRLQTPLAHGAGKYVLGLRGNTQIDTPTDSKQVSKRTDWYRLASKDSDGGFIKNRGHFVHVKFRIFRKGLALLNIP